MTVKELRDLLGQYPDEAQVFVVQERKPGKYAGKMMDAEVSWVIDQDTAEGSVCIWPKVKELIA
jgi:hypothetical protein